MDENKTNDEAVEDATTDEKKEAVETTEESTETAPQAIQEPEAGKETEDGEGKPTE